MKTVRIVFASLICGIISTAHADIASVQYVQSIISSINAANITGGTLDVALLPVGTTSGTVAAGNDSRFGTMATHIADTSNPHSVTKAQVGLGNVANVDTTDASNITSGTLATARLSVGTTSGTVAAGDDSRFGTMATHIADTSNPHSVTKAQVGLGNVANVDTTNAANITSGTLDVARLPVGSTSTTVAAGNDARFDTVSTTQPSGTPPTGTVFIWFN